MLTKDDLKKIADLINPRFDRIEKQLDNHDKHFDRIEYRLDGVEDKLDSVEDRLDGVEGRLDGFEGRFDRLENKFDDYQDQNEKDHKYMISLIEDGFARMSDMMLTMQDHGRRIGILERAVKQIKNILGDNYRL